MIRKRKVPIRIAVADDEPAVLWTFVRLLEQLGQEVVCAAANGEELVDRCLEDHVDLVFVDLNMPVMDGLAAAEHLQKKGIPVILVSGHPDAEHVIVEHEPVVSRFVKPLSLEDVQQAIELALRPFQSATNHASSSC
jgi:response regulator NasT